MCLQFVCRRLDRLMPNKIMGPWLCLFAHVHMIMVSASIIVHNVVIILVFVVVLVVAKVFVFISTLFVYCHFFYHIAAKS